MSSTNINLEKISNGFVLTIGSKKIFCDVPEAVCGAMAEWVLEECKNAEEGDQTVLMTKAFEQAMRLQEQLEPQRQTTFNPPWAATCDGSGKSTY